MLYYFLSHYLSYKITYLRMAILNWYLILSPLGSSPILSTTCIYTFSMAVIFSLMSGSSLIYLSTSCGSTPSIRPLTTYGVHLYIGWHPFRSSVTQHRVTPPPCKAIAYFNDVMYTFYFTWHSSLSRRTHLIM